MRTTRDAANGLFQCKRSGARSCQFDGLSCRAAFKSFRREDLRFSAAGAGAGGMGVAILLGGQLVRLKLRGDVKKRSISMLWTILVVLLILWLLGAIGGVGGSLIHLLLVVALVILVINLLTGRRTVV
jgi:hypothetical protein